MDAPLPLIDQLEQFQEKCEAVFRPELRENNKLERLGDSVKHVTALGDRTNTG